MKVTFETFGHREMMVLNSSDCLFLNYSLCERPVNGSFVTNSFFFFLLQVLLLIYTVIPLKLYLTIIMTTVYSLTFEILNGIIVDSQLNIVCVRIGLHVCIHLIGAHIMIMTQVSVSQYDVEYIYLYVPYMHCLALNLTWLGL